MGELKRRPLRVDEQCENSVRPAEEAVQKERFTDDFEDGDARVRGSIHVRQLMRHEYLRWLH